MFGLPAEGIFATLGSIVFFGGIALITWIDQRGKTRRREIEHTERMKSIELGHNLPDAEVARAQAERARARTAVLTATLVPLFMALAAVGGTVVTLLWIEASGILIPVLCTLWGVCGVVCIVTVSVTMGTIERTPKHDETAEQHSENTDPEPVSAAF